MNNYIIGIDGGGTKTIGALYDEKGKEILRAEFGFSNFSIDEKRATENIMKTIEALTKHRQKDDQIMVMMGISGATKIKNKHELIHQIEDQFNVKAELVTDAMIALYSIDRKDHDHVIMAIGGTGSAVMMLEDDQTTLLGGYGYLFGDEGSAYHLVIEAIKHIARSFDEGKPLSTLQTKLCEHMYITTRDELVSFVYSQTKTELARFAKIISECALASDEEAYLLLKHEAIGLAEQVMMASRRFQTKRPIRIGLRGGFIQNAPFVKSIFSAYIQEKLPLSDMEDHPNEAVLGAYRLAIKKLTSEVTSW